MLVSALLLIGFCWAYWPTWVQLLNAWSNEPDYSHGFLVLPFAAWILWARREKFPSDALQPAIISGLALVLASLLVRYLGARVYLDAVDGWSMLLLLTGIIVALAGWQVLWFCLPSIGLLIFMIPLPFRVEQLFRAPLQSLATKMSSATLVVLGQPAISEGNTIWIGDMHFGVAEACSGLRIFIGISALAYLYVALVRRTWWVKSLVLLAVVPVALIANSLRIVGTCLLQVHVSGEAADKFSHDIAGVIMIPLAAAMLGLVLWYAGKIFHEEYALASADAAHPAALSPAISGERSSNLRS